MSTLDRAPQFDVVRSDLLSIKRHLETAERSLDRIERALASEDAIGKYDAAYAREFVTPLETRAAPLVFGDLILSRQFELKARQFVEISLRQLEHLLQPLEFIGSTKRRGHPRIYSKTFLILRCARIFEMFDTNRRAAEVNQTNEAKRSRKGRLAPAYIKGLVPFVRKVITAIDPHLRDHRKQRFEPTLARHGGRLVKLTGDGALAEFPSAVDGLRAAIEFQQSMVEGQ